MRAIRCIRFIVAVLAAALLTIPAWAGPQPVQAVWVARKVHFVYRSFTTVYSCDGLRDEVEGLLMKLGARDLEIRPDPCIYGAGRPDPFAGVRVKMRVLVPAGPRVPAAAPRIAAHWHKVVLTSDGSELDYGGKCELISQFRRTVLPLFEPRRVDLRATCIPHQVTMDTYLSAEVLRPDHPPAAHATAVRRGRSTSGRKPASRPMTGSHAHS